MAPAVELERNDQLAEAERLIRASVPHLAFVSAITDIYRLRMLRSKGAGDAAAALAAFQQSSDFIFF